MNKQAKSNFPVAAFLLIMLLGASAADAQTNTAFGTGALPTPPSGSNLYDNAFGFDALHSNISGSGNVAVGYDALYSNMTGENNIASGAYALFSNTAGDFNTASGYLALYSDSTDSYNTASGAYALYRNTTGGDFNTASGANALYNNTTGSANTASGYAALYGNITGASNTASGFAALASNTTGKYNTASGVDALYSNNGSDNTASGDGSLRNNTTGGDNTASGVDALYSNNGNNNTASGYYALTQNTTGSYNTASGVNALFNNNGSDNTASGYGALQSNTSGSGNTASGVNALQKKNGSNNTASGFGALKTTTFGNNNIALGYNAGSVLVLNSSNDIDIGNVGGAPHEFNTIRIGTAGTQTAAFIAGISGVGVTGAPVEVSSTGQLGIVVSSARYKHDIRDMGGRSGALLKLRPVTFRYNNDPANTLQYGLVAEEVAKVYPELVVYGPDGKVMTVRYSMLSAMLLNELQKQNNQNVRQAQEVRRLSARLASTDGQIAEMRASQVRQRIAFQEQFAKLERELAARDSGGKLAAAFSIK